MNTELDVFREHFDRYRAVTLQFLDVVFGLSRKAHDEGRSQRDVGHPPTHAREQRIVGASVARTPHALEHVEAVHPAGHGDPEQKHIRVDLARQANLTLIGRAKGKRREAAVSGAQPAAGAAEAAPARQDETQEDEMASEEFDGPWPMFDDLLAAVLSVAERRVTADLRGDAARVAIRDFSLTLYKELLSELGDVVEEDEAEDEEDED